MARLKFDLTPIMRAEGDDEWVKRFFANNYPGETPRPCDCGYFGDDLMVHCREDDRARCRATAAKKLEEHHRRKHLDGLKRKREFPRLGRGKGVGWCNWCRREIWDAKDHHRLSRRRTWHPDCLTDYFLHTRPDTQRAHVLARDGIACRLCGVIEGKWARLYNMPERDGRWAYSAVDWQTPMEIDHTIALAVVWEAGLEPQAARWYFGPGNLRAICQPCHRKKTRADLALLKRARLMGPAWTALMVRRLATRLIDQIAA